MNFHEYRPYDMVNGLGVRSTLFVSGCIHGCKGCYNTKTWDPLSGREYTPEIEDRIIRDLRGEDKVFRKGLSLTGGDPLHESNLDVLLGLIKRVREECPDKDIWLWTGYTLEELQTGKELLHRKRWELCQAVDVIVDGKFEEDKKDPALLHRGSSNQNVYVGLERII